MRDKVIPMKRFLIACGPVAFIGASTSPLRASPTAGCPDESSHALAVAFRNGLYGGLPAGRGDLVAAPTIRRDHGSSSTTATPELGVRLFDLN